MTTLPPGHRVTGRRGDYAFDGRWSRRAAWATVFALSAGLWALICWALLG